MFKKIEKRIKKKKLYLKRKEENKLMTDLENQQRKGLFDNLNGLQIFLSIMGILGISGIFFSFIFGTVMMISGVITISNLANKKDESNKSENSQNINSQNTVAQVHETKNTQTEPPIEREQTQNINNTKLDPSENIDEIMNQVLNGNEQILNQYSPNELKIIRNTIYAKNGYIFKSNDLKNYFSQKPWYNGYVSDENQISLSPNEKRFINIVKSHE